MRRSLVMVGLGLIAWRGTAAAQIVGPSTGGAAGLAQAERMLGHTKRVLMIAAHPDDEDTELLTYLVRREGAVAGYLALTRGEGGQNLIGPELGVALGLVRSGELLSARQLDGARQFFTRAFDFGFSKTVAEALTFWPRDSVLKDVVRIVRRFRPQIIVSIFSGTPRDGHGQHQAAGWAAAEAFRIAGDPGRFPELMRDEGLEPWEPAKLYRSARFDPAGASLILDGGVLDPEIGQSVRQIAMRGRSLHRSQDMGMLQEVGPSPIRLQLIEDRPAGGQALFAGVDTSAPRAGTPEARDLVPYASSVAAHSAQLVFDAIAEAGRLVPGGNVSVRLSAWNAGGRSVPVVMDLDLPDGWQAGSECLGQETVVPAGQVTHCAVLLELPETAEPTTPYFLTRPMQGPWYQWTGPPARWGAPFDPPLAQARFSFRGPGGQSEVRREVLHRERDQALGERRHPLVVVPRVDVQISPAVAIWSLAERRPSAITVTLGSNGRDTTSGTVALDLPPGWPPVKPIPFRLASPGERRSVTFEVAPGPGAAAGDFAIRAVARDGQGTRYDRGDIKVAYPHIRENTYLVDASMTLRVADIRLPAVGRVGYVRGAADEVPEALAGVGLKVELLDREQLEIGDLSQYRVIVIGSRAYETDPALGPNNGRLLDYVRGGGHLVVQYQQQAFFRDAMSPYPMTVASPHDRVTDETAPIRQLVPDDPVFRTPNRIGPTDWDGWVQERGLYFAHSWDEHYRPLVESHDPGGALLSGGLLAADYGKGTYLYSGLAFFRQLRAGVPGALRLFLNLLSMESRAALP